MPCKVWPSCDLYGRSSRVRSFILQPFKRLLNASLKRDFVSYCRIVNLLITPMIQDVKAFGKILSLHDTYDNTKRVNKVLLIITVLQYLIPLYLLHLRQFTNCPVRTKTKHDERLSIRKSQLDLFWNHASGTTEHS